MKNKYTATGFAFVFGWCGLHKFYLGRWVQGLIYILLMVLTAWVLPLIISVFEAITYLFNSQEWFDTKYNAQYIRDRETIRSNR